MLLSSLLFVPIIGIFLISGIASYESYKIKTLNKKNFEFLGYYDLNKKYYKRIAFLVSILNLIISLIIYVLFDFSNNQFQFVQEHYNLSFFWYIFRYRRYIYIFCYVDYNNNAYSYIS